MKVSILTALTALLGTAKIEDGKIVGGSLTLTQSNPETAAILDATGIEDFGAMVAATVDAVSTGKVKASIKARVTANGPAYTLIGADRDKLRRAQAKANAKASKALQAQVTKTGAAKKIAALAQATAKA